MFKDVIKYEDFNGFAREETVYFNLSKMEAMELFASHPEGYSEYLKSVVDSGNSKLILDTFVDIVKMSYGVKSEDGLRFIKSDDLTEKFTQSPMYDEFMFRLASDENYMKSFVDGTIPKA